MSLYVENQTVGDRTHPEDWRVRGHYPLTLPDLLQHDIPQIQGDVLKARHDVVRVVHDQDPDERLLVILGPCSIHDPAAALDYSSRLLRLCGQDEKDLVINPDIDNSFQINKGLSTARQLFLDLTNSGMPLPSEMLGTRSPQFLAEMLSVGATGARTTESQLHRELASALSFPVGFKNGTDGTLDVAVDAIGALQHPHHFLYGNEDCFVLLREGKQGTNYDASSMAEAKAKLVKFGARPRLMMANGETGIMGAMIESNLSEGSQKAKRRLGRTRYNTTSPLDRRQRRRGQHGKMTCFVCLITPMDDPIPIRSRFSTRHG
ncbi:MAG: hypothetical protein M1826_004475 [Phylliscum demangeonii]|nr:MAG: hypothetical protein M1826_004475 [Phylliscum demangeonii]